MLRRALAGVLIVLAVLSLGVLGAAAVLDEKALDTGLPARLPQCPVRLKGGSCALCGMSHSLVAMAHGDRAAAARWNAAGPPLYGALVVVAAAGAVAGACSLTALFARGKRN